MKTQKYYSVSLIYGNFKYGLGRNVIEAFLQFFFDTELSGKELASFIGNKEIYIIDLRPKFQRNEGDWWEEAFAVTMIKNK